MKNNLGKTNNNIKFAEEYQNLQATRNTWSSGLGRYNQIFVPAVFIVLTLVFTQLPYFINDGKGFEFLFIGWCIITSIIIIWRAVRIHVDRAIVFLYPRMLELEDRLNYEYFTSYFFRYLSKDAKLELRDYLKEKGVVINIDELNKYDLRKFKEILKSGKIKETSQKIFLKIWDSFMDKKPRYPLRIWDFIWEPLANKFGYNTGKYYRCVSSRGHRIFDAFAFIVPIGYFVIVFILRNLCDK